MQQGVEEFVQADGGAGVKARVKVVALHHAGDGVLGRQLDHAARAQLVAPLAVVAQLGFFRAEHFVGLGAIGFGVGADLFGAQRRAGGVAAARVANEGGEVANEEDDGVAQVLQLAQLVEYDGVAQMDVGRGGVQAQFDAQRLAGGFGAGEFLFPVGGGQQFIAAAQGDLHGFAHAVGDGKGA